MTAVLRVIKGMSHIVNTTEIYTVMVDHIFIACYADEAAARRVVHLLNEARSSNLHNAMNILVQHIGFAEEYAKQLYYFMLSDGMSTTVN